MEAKEQLEKGLEKVMWTAHLRHNCRNMDTTAEYRWSVAYDPLKLIIRHNSQYANQSTTKYSTEMQTALKVSNSHRGNYPVSLAPSVLSALQPKVNR